MLRDKALLELGGETLVERGLLKLREVCPEVAIAGGAPELGPFGRVIADTRPGCGPLAGIVAALEQSEFEWNLFLAVDMAFVPARALHALLSAVGGPELVVVAQAEGQVHPLCGVYSRGALGALRTELEAGRLKVKDAIAATGAYSYLPFDEEKWFRNLNTPEDFSEALGFERE